jgi:hypothetical protein
MKFLSLEPFVPSGPDYKKSKSLFLALGFTLTWENEGMAGFEREGCRFILQHFDNKFFAENYMLSVKVSSAQEIWNDIMVKNLPEKFGIRVNPPEKQPYGIEVNMIDVAGVCWHFVEWPVL